MAGPDGSGKIHRQLQEAVDSLVRDMESADEVAAWLAQQGIKGVPGDAGSCPLANYFGSQLEWEYHVFVREGGIATRSPATDRLTGHIETHPTLQKFIQNFDGGDYPELES